MKLVKEAERKGLLKFRHELLRESFWRQMDELMQKPALPLEDIDFSLPPADFMFRQRVTF